jgi:hypothetical protein
MGQAAAIVINDGATTPVAVTFSPEKVTPESSVFVDRRKTSRSLQPSLEIGLSPATSKRKTYRISYGLTYPLEGLVNGIAAPVDVARASGLSVIVPESMSQTDRKHFHAFFVNALSAALFKALFTDLDPIY